MPAELITPHSEAAPKLELLSSNFNPETTFSDKINQKTAGITNIVDLKDVYDYAGTKLGYISKYPTYNPNRDNEDFYAQQQTKLDVGVNMAKTFGVLATNTFANHFNGYANTVQAGVNREWDELWKDSFGEDIAQSVRAQANLNPIYETKEQRAFNDSSTGAWGALKQFVPFVSNRAGIAWANLASQVGFMAGTAGAVALETAALGALTAGSGGAVAPVTGAKAAMNVSKVLKSFTALVAGGRDLFKIKGAGNTINMVNKLTTMPRMYIAAAGEASIEANMGALDFKENQTKMFEQLNGRKPNEVEMADIEDRAIKVGNTTFGWNIPVLMVSNAATIGNLFKPGNIAISDAARTALKIENKYLSSKGFLSGVFKESPKMQKVLEYGRKGTNILTKDKVFEGVEEVMQGVGSRAAAHQYDLYSSDFAKGTNGFLALAGQELSETMGTREGWDEFFSGYFTGMGMSMAGTVRNKVPTIQLDGGLKLGPSREVQAKAETAKLSAQLDTFHESMLKEFKTKQKETTSPLNGGNSNVLIQGAVQEAMERNVSENNIEEAKNLKVDSKLSTFAFLSRTGVGEAYFEQLGSTMKEIQEKDKAGYEEMMGDRSVEDVVSQLKAEFKIHQQTARTIGRNVGNAYKEGTKEYNAREYAIQYAAGIELKSKDAQKRAVGLRQEIMNDHAEHETLVMALMEPNMIVEQRGTQELVVKGLRDSISLQEGTQKEISQKQLVEAERKLEILNNLEEVGKKEWTSKQDIVSQTLEAYFGTDKTVSADLRQKLEDMKSLDRDNQDYTFMYNLLSNKEYFEKFGESFVATAMQREQDMETEATQNSYSKPVETSAVLTEQEFIDTLDNIEDATNLGPIIEFAKNVGKDLVDKISVTKKDGVVKVKYKNKEYEVKDLLEVLIDEYKIRDTVEANDIKKSLTELLNGIVNDIYDPKEAHIVNEPTNTDELPNHIILGTPKTKAEADVEVFGFSSGALKQTLLHAFDLIIGNTWGKNGVSSIKAALNRVDVFAEEALNKQREEELALGGDEEIIEEKYNKLIADLPKNKKNQATLSDIEKANDALNNDTELTLLYLADESVIFAKEGSKEKASNSSEFRVVTDGIRFYILTSTTSLKEDGTPKTAKEIIQENLDLHIENYGQATIVRNKEGNTISSPFREGLFNEESDDAIHTLKAGEVVRLKVSDKEFNQELLKKLEAKEITEEEYIDNLLVEAIIENENGEEVTVGILRATDFLFESKADKRAEISKYRNQLLGKSLGEPFGNTTFTASSTARGKNLVDGKVQYTTLSKYNPVKYITEYFYATENGLINEKGEIVEASSFDRGKFVLGAVYLKVSGEGNAKNHTVQVFGEVTAETFKDGTFKETMETDLSLDTPIISKRIIVDLGNIKDVEDESTKQESVAEEVEDNTVSSKPSGKLDNKPTITDSIWGNFVDTGNVPDNIVGNIVKKIVEGKELTTKELAIRQGYAKKIEGMLSKEIIKPKKRKTKIKPPTTIKSEIDFTDKIVEAMLELEQVEANISNLTDTEAFLDSFLDEVSAYTGEGIAKMKNEVLKLKSLIKSNSKKNTNKGKNVQEAIDSLRADASYDREIANKLIDRLTDIKNQVKQLQEVAQALQEKISYWEGLSETEYGTKEAVNNRIKVLQGQRSLLINLIDILKQAVQSGENILKDMVEIIFTKNNSLQTFLGLTGFKEKSTSDLRKDLDSGADTDSYAKLKADYDYINDGLNNALDNADTQEAINSKKTLTMQETSQAVSRIDQEIRNLEELLEPVGTRTQVTITDNSGIEVTVNNPEIVGENLEHDGGSIALTDIQSAEQPTEEAPAQEPQEEWKVISTKELDEVFTWLLKEGYVGTEYPLPDGTTLTVLTQTATEVTVRMDKDGLIQEIGFNEQGEAKRISPDKAKTYSINNALQYMLNMHGISMAALKALSDTYKQSVEDGTPITNLGDLMQAAGFTEQELQDMDDTLTSATTQNFWEFITQSETMFEEAGLEKLNNMLQELQPILDNLEAVSLSSSPVEVEKRYLNNLWEEVKSIFKKYGAKLDLNNLRDLNNDGIKELIGYLKEDLDLNQIDFREKFVNLQNNFKKLGLTFQMEGLMQIQKVSKNSLGRNPKMSIEFNSFLTDVSFWKEGFVRNEEDGLFVEVKSSSKTLSPAVKRFQQQLKQSLGIAVHGRILQSYEKINGNFEGLRERLQLEVERRNSEQEKTTIKEEDILEQTAKYLTTDINSQEVEFAGKTYLKMLENKQGEYVYVEQGKILSPEEVSEMIKTPSTYVPKNSSLTQRANKIRKIQDKINNMVC